MAINDKVLEPKVGDTYTLNGEEFTVGPKCDTDRGNWVCATHGEAFGVPLAKEMHVGDMKEHVMVWNCHEHGPEVP